MKTATIQKKEAFKAYLGLAYTQQDFSPVEQPPEKKKKKKELATAHKANKDA